jgi:ATP-binding cassette subfamily B protein
VITAQVLRSSVFSKLEDKAAPIRREFDAYYDASCGKGFFKETRNLGSFGYLKSLLVGSINSLNAAIWGANKRSSLIDFGFNTLSLLGYGGIMFLLVKYLLDGEISVGAFAAVYNSIGMLFAVMNEVISMHLGNLANNFGQIRNFLRFLDIPSDNRANLDISKKEGITVENASFTYPNAEKESLKNINLHIKPGETIAIVGENGAGKTTLVKLLTGLYKPTGGSVKIGETDLNTISYRSLFENISGVFQKYQRYALTLKENIQIANFASENNVEQTLAENHIDHGDKDTFPDGLDTMLSREFDGVDLSGGQWQRVAIARGFYRESDIIVLDEPTAAIDPLEESAIYKKFVEVAKDKTAVIVTHRMGSAKIAGRIVVMRDGEIAEIGAHDELVEKGGLYAGMYAAQAGWYN